MKHIVVFLLSLVCSFSVLADSERSVSLGLAKDKAWNSGRHQEAMVDHGLTDHATVYLNLQDSYDWVNDEYLEKGLPVILTLIIGEKNESGLLQKIISGGFDGQLAQLARKIKDNGHQLVVRPLHELDASWHPWGMYYKGNTPEMAVSAFARIVKIFRAANAPVTFEANLNRRDGKGQVLGEAERYLPQLNKLVDAYSISTYNRCGTRKSETESHSFADEFRPVYEKLSQFTDKPINVAEVSTAGLCEEKMPWFETMMADIERDFPKVEQVTFFFGRIAIGEASNDVPVNWSFDSSVDRDQFRQLINRYQTKWGSLEKESSQITLPNIKVGFDGQKVDSGFRAPWFIWSRYSLPIDEMSNPVINPVTRDVFGKSGPVFRLEGYQRFLWPTDSGFMVGPGLRFGVVHSPNQNQWWNNYTTVGASFGFYKRLSAGPNGWGNFELELVAERRNYNAPTPVRFGNGNEDRIEVRATFGFGGDWAR